MSHAGVIAHAAHGEQAPEWLLIGGLVVFLGLLYLGLRSSWPAARLQPTAGRLLGPGTAPVLAVLGGVTAAAGLVVWALTLSAGLFATTNPTENLAPFVVSPSFLLGGGVLLSAVIGDWWAAASPFATLARLVVPPGERHRRAPWWVGPAMAASFLWLAFAAHDGGQPRWVGVWLAGYTVAVLLASLWWGRSFAARDEGFAVLFGAVAGIAPLHRDQATGRLGLRPPLAGLASPEVARAGATVTLLAAAAVTFGAVRQVDWWQAEIVGVRSGWRRTEVDTFGLLFSMGAAASVWTTLTRRSAPRDEGVVPLGAGVVVAFLLTDLLTRAIDVLALLSDPYDRGWNLLGTDDWFADPAWQQSGRLAVVEIAAIVIGAALAVVVTHDRSLAAGPTRARGQQSTAHRTVAIAVLATLAFLVLLA
jgi:hypothetical protein